MMFLLVEHQGSVEYLEQGAYDLQAPHDEGATWKSLDITEIRKIVVPSLVASMARTGGSTSFVHSWEAACLVHITILGSDGIHNTRRPSNDGGSYHASSEAGVPRTGMSIYAGYTEHTPVTPNTLRTDTRHLAA